MLDLGRTDKIQELTVTSTYHFSYTQYQWRTEGEGVVGFKHPKTPEISKALQNRSKLNPIVKTVKNC